MNLLLLLPRTVLRLAILAYRYSLSMFMGRRCRYLPTCSEFADEAIARHGAWAGGWMAAGRDLPVPSLGRRRLRSRAARIAFGHDVV